MANTIYAAFTDPNDAERAAGALLDHGVRAEDLSIVRQHGQDPSVEQVVTEKDRDNDIEGQAKHGISTTTAADAGAGAIKGTAWGAGIGAVAALAALAIPGVGLVVGGGALAAALGGVAASAAAGAVAGGVTGYLHDQGVDEHVAKEYHSAINAGGALLAVALPSGDVGETEARTVLEKYKADNINAYATRGYVA